MTHPHLTDLVAKDNLDPMTTFSPVNSNGLEMRHEFQRESSSPRHIPLQPSASQQQPLRDAILKASGALNLQDKRRRINAKRVNNSLPPPRGRLCSPPLVLREMNVSTRILENPQWDGLATRSDLTTRDVLPHEDDDVFQDQTDHPVLTVNDFLPENQFHDVGSEKENISPVEIERVQVYDTENWDDQFSSDSDILQEINGDSEYHPSLQNLFTPTNTSHTLGEFELFPSNQESAAAASASASASAPSQPTPFIDLTFTSPESNSHHTTSSSPLQSTPFMRPSFPSSLHLYPPIPNLNRNSKLLTCFRLAEVLRVVSSTPPSQTLYLEIFAQITSSHRTSFQNAGIQYFTFSDLFFPSRPPQLQGTYTGWKGIALFEDDGNPFLEARPGKGILCRAICVIMGRKRNSIAASVPDTKIPRFKVLNIWKAGWEDMEYTKSLVL